MSYLARLFAAPWMAFFATAAIVSAFGYLFYRIGNSRKPAGAERYWRLVSLLGELCLAVGLVGLATFAGRMTVSADHQILQERVLRSQSAVGENLRLAIVRNCAPAGRQALEPYSPAVARKELCAIAREYVDVHAADADWVMAEKSLREFGTKYPGCIPNVFTRHSDCDETVEEAVRIADEVGVLEQDRRTSRGDEAMSAMLEAPGSGAFMLLAFLIAAIGVSIKCARAAAEFFALGKSAGK